MTGAEVARLARRADEQDETPRAIGDTLLDVKETVDGHSEELAAVKQTQQQHTELLNQHSALLNQHTELLNQHTELLTEILRRLDSR